MRDVVIIGAGPAGSAAAILCAQNNLRVTLVEGLPFPRDVPGETLHPGVESLLGQLGVAKKVLSAGFLRHAGHWVQWGQQPQFVPFGSDQDGPWLGFQAWRSRFDEILLNRARALGVKILQPVRALRPLLERNTLVGVLSSEGPLRSRFVIDAAGSRHWLARQMKLEIRRHSRRLIVRYGYVEGNAPIFDDAPYIKSDREGWTWIAQVQDGVYQWTRTDGDRVPPELDGLRPRGRIRGADATWRMVIKSAGAGYFLVGDSAAVLDPASSHGVLKAITSGMMAAHLITQVLHRDLPEDEAILCYRHWLSNWFHHDVAKLAGLYSIFGKSFSV
jgi:flavin-dependent dehydrogenase